MILINIYCSTASSAFATSSPTTTTYDNSSKNYLALKTTTAKPPAVITAMPKVEKQSKGREKKEKGKPTAGRPVRFLHDTTE